MGANVRYGSLLANSEDRHVCGYTTRPARLFRECEIVRVHLQASEAEPCLAVSLKTDIARSGKARCCLSYKTIDLRPLPPPMPNLIRAAPAAPVRVDREPESRNVSEPGWSVHKRKIRAVADFEEPADYGQIGFR